MAKAFEYESWECETNVLSPGEENDLIIHEGREYYLVECKWQKEPVEKSLIAILRDKLTSRPGMRGIFASMSGYTSGALADVKDRIEASMILLFGPQDLEEGFSSVGSLTDLIDEKFYSAMTHNEILVH